VHHDRRHPPLGWYAVLRPAGHAGTAPRREHVMRSTRSHTPQEVWDRPFVKEHQEWCDDFVVELRLRDVPGTVIGDHLAEVETHCGESGETPREAFGEPVEYARHLAEESDPEPVTGVWTVVLLSVGQLLGLLVGTSAAWSWARGEELSYNLAQ